MAKGYGVDFKGFEDLAEQIDGLGEGLLLEAVKQAFQASKDYVNGEIETAMRTSKFSFTAGVNYSQGDALKSLHEVSQLPVEVNGTVVKAYAGVNLEKAPEALILAIGTPHTAKDSKLSSAVRVKGKVRKEVLKIQEEVFNEILEKGLKS